MLIYEKFLLPPGWVAMSAGDLRDDAEFLHDELLQLGPRASELQGACPCDLSRCSRRLLPASEGVRGPP